MLPALISCLQSKNPDVRFWNWFKRNEVRLFEFERDQDRVFEELQVELRRIDPNLTFEFGPILGGKREFVISAGGIVSAFPSVRRLADSHPELPRWKITAFKPRRTEAMTFEFQGLKIASTEVQFSMDATGTKPAITLYFRGYQPTDHDRFGSIGYLMLDHFLGEYDVETKLGGIDFADEKSSQNLAKHPLSELASTIDKLADPPR